MAAHRILAFDGGTGTAVYLRYLRAIEQARPGFLAKADALAGTSDGSVAALLLARYTVADRNLAALDTTITRVDELLRRLQLGVLNWLRLATGVVAASAGDRIESLFETWFGNETLTDLHAPVTVVAYGLRNPSGVQVHHNYQTVPTPRVVDVIMRSGAFPVLLPIRSGDVDGGLFANNPSMVALAHAVSSTGSFAGMPLTDVRMCSMGYACRSLGGPWMQSQLLKKRTDWGWIPWFLLPGTPLLFVQALFNSADRGAEYQCGHLLGDRFLRVSVPSPFGVITGMPSLVLGKADAIIDQAGDLAEHWETNAADPAAMPCFQDTLDWVDANWMV